MPSCGGRVAWLTIVWHSLQLWASRPLTRSSVPLPCRVAVACRGPETISFGAVIAGVWLATARRELFRQGWWLLGSVIVFRTLEDAQLLEHLPPQRALRQHALYGRLQNALRVLLEHRLE